MALPSWSIITPSRTTIDPLNKTLIPGLDCTDKLGMGEISIATMGKLLGLVLSVLQVLMG
jgi:hypothetical protein